MLVRICTPDDILLDDPVRPNIPPEDRVDYMADVFMWIHDKKVGAVLCLCYQNSIPTTEAGLFKCDSKAPYHAILYSVWSYDKGCGRALVNATIEHAREMLPHRRIITMSPKTEMAERFHLGNGAVLLRTNEETVNYEY
jgi:hypothetical protein